VQESVAWCYICNREVAPDSPCSHVAATSEAQVAEAKAPKQKWNRRKAQIGQLVEIVYHSRLQLSLRTHLGHKGRVMAADHRAVGPRANQVKLQYFINCECGGKFWTQSQCFELVV